MDRAIIAGSRGFYDYELLKKVADKCIGDDATDVEVISGTAMGADRLGEQYAKERGFKVKRFYPNWTRHGKAAGYIRNLEMARYASQNKSYVPMLLAFWDGKSNGTRHMINIAKNRNINTHVIKYNTNEYGDITEVEHV